MTDFTMNMAGIEIEADDETRRIAFVGKSHGPSKFKAALEEAVAKGEKAVDAVEIGRRAGTNIPEQNAAELRRMAAERQENDQ